MIIMGRHKSDNNKRMILVSNSPKDIVINVNIIFCLC